MIKLKQPLGRSSPADLFDVLQIKTALGKLGYYEPHDNAEITGFTDNGLFEGILKFQKDQNLFPNGAINHEDKTLENLNHRLSKIYASNSRKVESEELPPLRLEEPKIPGTNIPDRGVPEQGWPGSKVFDPFEPIPSKNADRKIIKRKPINKISRMPVYTDDNWGRNGYDI